MPTYGPWLDPVGTAFANVYPERATPHSYAGYESDLLDPPPTGAAGGWNSARRGLSVSDGSGTVANDIAFGFRILHQTVTGVGPTKRYYASQLLIAADLSRIVPEFLPAYRDRPYPPGATGVEWETVYGTLVASPRIKFQVPLPYDFGGANEAVPLDSLMLYQLDAASATWDGGDDTPVPHTFIDPDSLDSSNFVAEVAPSTVTGDSGPSPLYDSRFGTSGTQAFLLAFPSSLLTSSNSHDTGYTEGFDVHQQIFGGWVYVEYIGPRYRFVYDTGPVEAWAWLEVGA